MICDFRGCTKSATDKQLDAGQLFNLCSIHFDFNQSVLSLDSTDFLFNNDKIPLAYGSINPGQRQAAQSTQNETWPGHTYKPIKS